jgi:hypothetical protein
MNRPIFEIPHVNEFTYNKKPDPKSQLALMSEDVWYNHWNVKSMMYELYITLGKDVSDMAKEMEKSKLEKLFCYLAVYLNGGICVNDGVKIVDEQVFKDFLVTITNHTPTPTAVINDSGKVLLVVGIERDPKIKLILQDMIANTQTETENIVVRSEESYSWLE